MEIQILTNPINRKQLKEMAQKGFGDIVKAVVDVRQEIVALGGEFHSEEETLLMDKHNAKREETWGINLYPDRSGDEFIEFDSMINLKPAFGNRSRIVEDEATREKINKIIERMIIAQ